MAALHDKEGSGCMAGIVTGTDESFEAEVLKADIPGVVDFSAAWCAPCRAMEPTMEEIAREQAGKLKVVKFNVDDSSCVATRFRVQSLPTLIVFLNGQPVDRVAGLLSKDKLMARFGDHIRDL